MIYFEWYHAARVGNGSLHGHWLTIALEFFDDDDSSLDDGPRGRSRRRLVNGVAIRTFCPKMGSFRTTRGKSPSCRGELSVFWAFQRDPWQKCQPDRVLNGSEGRIGSCFRMSEYVGANWMIMTILRLQEDASNDIRR